MTRRVLEIEKLQDNFRYQVLVEFSEKSFFGLGPVRTWRQYYRGRIVWKNYPQGTEMWEDDLMDWLTAQVQQYEWSLEHHAV